MTIEAKLLLLLMFTAFTFTPLCRRMFPYTLSISHDEFGWSWRIDRTDI